MINEIIALFSMKAFVNVIAALFVWDVVIPAIMQTVRGMW